MWDFLSVVVAVNCLVFFKRIFTRFGDRQANKQTNEQTDRRISPSRKAILYPVRTLHGWLDINGMKPEPTGLDGPHPSTSPTARPCGSLIVGNMRRIDRRRRDNAAMQRCLIDTRRDELTSQLP